MSGKTPYSGPSGDTLGKEFRKDAEELLEALSKELLCLDRLLQTEKRERNAAWSESRDTSLRKLFQSVRTLKSLAGTFGYARLTRVSSALEDTLRELRLLARPLDRSVLDSLFVGLESLQTALANPERSSSSFPPGPPIKETLKGSGLMDRATVPTSASQSPAAREKEERDAWIPAELAQLEGMLQATGQLLSLRPMVQRLTKGLRSGASPAQLLRELRDLNLGLERHAGDVQHALLETRKVPVQELFDRLGVLVDKWSQELGRVAKVSFSGGTTRIDREIGDTLEDPLSSMVKGAIDRSPRGKEAHLGFRAFSKGDDVVIEMEGDTSPKRSSLPPPASPKEDQGEQAKRPSLVPSAGSPLSRSPSQEHDSGFRTLKSVVGKLGGIARVRKEKNDRSTVALRVPSTPELFRALIVGMNDVSFALPLHMVRGVLRFRLDQVRRKDQEVLFSWDDQQIPLRRYPTEKSRQSSGPPPHSQRHVEGSGVPRPTLPPGPSQPAQLFDEDASTLVASGDQKGAIEGRSYVVVLQGEADFLGLLVEQVLGEEEIAVRPVEKEQSLDDLAMGIARVGCADSADGKVMVVDPHRLMEELSPAPRRTYR